MQKEATGLKHVGWPKPAIILLSLANTITSALANAVTLDHMTEATEVTLDHMPEAT